MYQPEVEQERDDNRRIQCLEMIELKLTDLRHLSSSPLCKDRKKERKSTSFGHKDNTGIPKIFDCF